MSNDYSFYAILSEINFYGEVMAKDKGRFDKVIENANLRADNAEAYFTRKIGARVDEAKANLLHSGDDREQMLIKAADKRAKADFAKRALDGVEALKGEPAVNGEKAFREIDKLPHAPIGMFSENEGKKRVKKAIDPDEGRSVERGY